MAAGGLSSLCARLRLGRDLSHFINADNLPTRGNWTMLGAGPVSSQGSLIPTRISEVGWSMAQ